MNKINIILLGSPISTQHLYGQRGKIRYMKKEAKELKEHYIYQVEQQYNGPIIEDSLLLIVKYYFPDNRRRDRDNRHKLICDSMTGIVYKDDSQIKEASVEMLVDKEKPRIEIYINNYNL